MKTHTRRRGIQIDGWLRLSASAEHRSGTVHTLLHVRLALGLFRGERPEIFAQDLARRQFRNRIEDVNAASELLVFREFARDEFARVLRDRFLVRFGRRDN